MEPVDANTARALETAAEEAFDGTDMDMIADLMKEVRDGSTCKVSRIEKLNPRRLAHFLVFSQPIREQVMEVRRSAPSLSDEERRARAAETAMKMIELLGDMDDEGQPGSPP